MADDMVIHFASNSSNQSDQSLPTRIAKLEARMVGKASSVTSQANSWSAPAIFGAAENVAEAAAISSDSDDDDRVFHRLQLDFSSSQSPVHRIGGRLSVGATHDPFWVVTSLC
ncbi:serine/threonine-protein kinase TOUSLED-like isoform X2 [Solanum dulcamara]|uniref:serine/threonine-protein kinase TOUSLED-like isoform X2 n=1 Tax=Solanum dulcamara TaxID=45834 RepID=UPI0024854E98|nr:serine/threonine-protein kinase TOUSLED-like isoform X2 [Solanum dulcamara]